MQISSMGGSGIAQMLQQMQQKAQTAFTGADTDGDGKLSKTEFSAFDAAMKADAPQGATGTGQAMPTADEMFSKMDTDGDGSVTMAEVQAHAPRGPLSSATMGTLLQSQEADTTGSSDTSLASTMASTIQGMLDKIKDAFTAADKDGDGKLSATEFADFDKSLQAMAGGDDATKTAETANISNLFSKLDADSSGGVSLDEVMKGLEQVAAGGGQSTTATASTDTTDTTQTAAAGKGGGGGGGGGGKTYDALDTNKDGYVSAEELAAANNPMSSTGTSGDMLSNLIQQLLSNYSQNTGDVVSAMTSTTSVAA